MVLQDFKQKATGHLAFVLHITFDQAKKVIQLLETEDMIKLYAPMYSEKPATVLIKNRQLLERTLNMTSYKIGNIIINTYLDWKSLASAVATSVETVYSLNFDNPILVMSSIFCWLLSMSNLIGVNIEENEVAIIMALQQHKRHKIFATTEEQCMKEANDILTLHNYNVMDKYTFQEAITKLVKIECVKIGADGEIQLIEKIILPY